VASARDVDVYAPTTATPGQVSPLTTDAKAWLTGPERPTPHLSGTIAGRRCDLYDLATLTADHPARTIVGYPVLPFQQLVVVWDPKTG
jgi:hypothetical protein